jgi:hypothetical protein
MFGCLIAFGSMFFLSGLIALIASARQYSTKPDAIVGIIVGSVFTLVGGGLVVGVLFGASSMRRTEARKAQYPAQPWMWREDWANRAIRDSNKGAAIGIWIFAVIWNAISFPIAWKVTPELSRDNLMPLLVYLFPLVGIILLITAIYLTFRAAKFGTSICHLDRTPLVPGRAFRGDLEVRTDATPANGYRLRLALINAVTTGRGKNRSTHENLLWDSETLVESAALLRSPMGTRVPFQFAIPPDSHPCDDTVSDNRFFWRLSADADLPGVDYNAQFELPVFATGEAVDGSEFAAFEQRHRSQALRQQVAPTTGVEITRLPAGGEQYRIHAKKTAGGVIGGLIFLALWNAAIGAMIHFGAPWGIPAFFILLDLLFIASMFDYFFGRSTIEVDKSGVRVRKQWLGWSPGIATYETASIESIDGTAASPNSKTYGITLKRNDERPVILASSLPDRESADAVAAKMMADLGRA